MKDKLSNDGRTTTRLLLGIAFELGDTLKSSNSDTLNFRVVLETLGRKLKWDYGEVWFVDHFENKIVKSDITYLSENSSNLIILETFRSHASWNLNEGIPGVAWGKKKPIWISDFAKKESVHHKNLIIDLSIKCGVAIPIFSGEHIIAVLFFMSKSSKELNEIQMDLFELLAGRLGMLLIKIDLEREMIQMQQKLKSSIDLNFSTLNKILMYRDPYTVDHQKKVSEIAYKIAIESGYSSDDIDDLILASQLHDIGKLAIPIEILNKPGKISKEEYALIKTHVETSYDLISTLPCSDNVKRIIHEHHEREDGSGYPNRLISADISPLSKILIVSDVISAMLEDRPYRKGLDRIKIIEELVKGREVHYDSKSVDLALKHIDGFI